ncbi:MAG: prepilin-type N-terminal cleavage/methylation domain-containing protein [Fibrobacteria bacterium]|nr:prepilin-type N-terminal cleavage/methylation domain-containing protein [Fibrobacteria bacterium]
MNQQKVNPQRGITLVELLVTMLISSIVIFIVAYTFQSMSKGAKEMQDIAEIQAELKLAFQQIKKDMGNAGGGLAEGSAFPTQIKSNEITFSFMDRLKNECGKNETTITKIRYLVSNHTLYRGLFCDDVHIKWQNLFTYKNGVNLVFTYYNEKGQVTGNSADVRAVKFSLTITTKKTGQMDKSRLASGLIHINY